MIRRHSKPTASPIAFRNALAIAFAAVLSALVGLFLWAFVTGTSLSVPLFLQVEQSSPAGGGIGTDISFPLVGPLALTLVGASLIWLTARTVRHSALHP